MLWIAQAGRAKDSPQFRWLLLWGSVVLAGGLSGCGGGEQPFRKPTRRVVGVVTVDGAAPTSPVQIQCHPVNGVDAAHPTVSASLTGDGGQFEISTYETGDGVPAGDYALTFEWREYNAISASYGGPDKLKKRYQDPLASETKFTVAAGGTGDEETDLGTIALTTK
jgi:hypothetical protein